MKLLAAFFVALTFLSVPASINAAEPDTPEARARLVDEYFSYMPMSKMMSEMVQGVSKQVPENQRPMFVDTLTKNMRFDVIESAARQSLAKHLTLSELELFVEFIKHPEARSAMDKMKFYMADLLPVIRQEVIRASQMTATAKEQ